MNLTSLIIEQAIIMMLLIAVGMICFKLKIISENGCSEISKLVLSVVNPIVIFMSFQRELNSELVHNLLISFVLSAVAYAVAIAVSMIVFRNTENSNPHKISIERFSSIYSNCGFMGIPLVNALFGNEGVFYLTAFLTFFNLLSWTHGIMLISEKKDFKSVLNAMRSPAVISIFLGLLFFIFQIKLPVILSSTLEFIENTNTPFAMFAAGASIVQTNIFKAIKKPRIYLVCFIRLIFIPLLLILIFMPFDISRSVLLTIVVSMAAPSATMCTLLCIKFGKDRLYASEIFAVTTLLSMFTMPFMVFVAEKIIG